MGKKKKTTTQQQTTNTFDQITPRETADTAAARDWKPQANPAIPYAFSAARTRQRGNLNNVLGGNYSATEKDMIANANDAALTQQESQALSEEGYGMNAQELAKRQFMATLTAPRIVQTGGSSTGTQVYNPGWGQTVQGVIGAGIGLA